MNKLILMGLGLSVAVSSHVQAINWQFWRKASLTTIAAPATNQIFNIQDCQNIDQIKKNLEQVKAVLPNNNNVDIDKAFMGLGFTYAELVKRDLFKKTAFIKRYLDLMLTILDHPDINLTFIKNYDLVLKNILVQPDISKNTLTGKKINEILLKALYEPIDNHCKYMLSIFKKAFMATIALGCATKAAITPGGIELRELFFWGSYVFGFNFGFYVSPISPINYRKKFIKTVGLGDMLDCKAAI